jgi:hypothetical protein
MVEEGLVAVKVSKLYIFGGCLDSPNTDITSDQLNVQVMLDLPNFFDFMPVVLESYFIVNWPLLERPITFQTSNRLV